MLSFMSSFLEPLRATNMTSDTFNSTDDNVTEQHNGTSSANQQDTQYKLNGLFVMSCIILGFSLLNLLLDVPVKSLIRNARTSALMSSREMESKNVPVPIGDYTYKSNKPTKLNLRPPLIQMRVLSLSCHESLQIVEVMLAKKNYPLLPRSSHTK